MDRFVVREIDESSEWEGVRCDFEGCKLESEVRLPLRAVTTAAKAGFHDKPIRLLLEGRDGLPLCSNDGARYYMHDSPASLVTGEIGLLR